MSQKYRIRKCTNSKSSRFNSYLAHLVYDKKFIETRKLANYIQQQASVNFMKPESVTAATLSPKILFLPEYTTQTTAGTTRSVCAMVSEITFEEAPYYDEPEAQGGNNSGGGSCIVEG